MGGCYSVLMQGEFDTTTRVCYPSPFLHAERQLPGAPLRGERATQWARVPAPVEIYGTPCRPSHACVPSSTKKEDQKLIFDHRRFQILRLVR